MHIFGDLHTISFLRKRRLNFIGHVSRMDSKRKLNHVFNNNPRGRRLRGRPKNKFWNCVQTGTNKCKITNWKEVQKHS
jgi:hypothetical protein